MKPEIFFYFECETCFVLFFFNNLSWLDYMYVLDETVFCTCVLFKL